MKRIRKAAAAIGLPCLAGLLFILGCAQGPSPASTRQTIEPDSAQTGFMLPVPADPAQRAYLGLETTGTFTLNDIRAQVLVIEIFNFYCPHCQREAPNVNRFYHRISSDPDLRERIKLIGIGVSNTRFEVNQFREAFDIQFPLFPDRSRQVVRALDVRQTPTFIGLVWKTKDTPHRFMHVAGEMGNADKFLSEVLRLSEIQ